MRSEIKWCKRGKGLVTVDSVREMPVKVAYRGTDGKVYGAVDGVRVTGFCGEIPVITVTLAGNHPMTKANFREAMARKVQARGGSWMGRTRATESAKADARIARMYDPRVTPSAPDRKALRDAYYGGTPHPSDY